MERTQKFDYTLIIVSTIFILANSFFTTRNIFLFSVVPPILLLLAFFLFSPQHIFFLIVFLTPLSIPLRRIVPGLDFDFWVPTEPLIFGLLLLLIVKSFQENYFDKKLLNHPVFWILTFYLGWIFISIFPSELPLVSLKFLLVRVWYIGVFFYLGYHLFRNKKTYYKYFLWVFILGMIIVSSITLIKHTGIGLFNQKAAHGACTPFFIDHTSYGATIAFTIMMIIGLISVTKNRSARLFLMLMFLYFLAALVFSYSRAAWISVIFALIVGVLWLLKIRFRTIVFSVALVLGITIIFNNNISVWLRENKTESSGNLKEHLNSIINIKTDASNLERLNRWNAAIRMFKERPLFGWGPGTYMFYYAPFQRSYQKTIISTNFGTQGNAHSEYLGLLSETGLPALFAYLLLIVVVIYRGLKISRSPETKEYKILIISSLLGIITYVVHGIMNNFLDCDKIAIPFWGSIAFIVAMDTYVERSEKVVKSGELKA